MPNTPKGILIDMLKLPVAIESKLPKGAPKLSIMIAGVADKLPNLPAFPVNLPPLPDIPIPTMPSGMKLPNVNGAVAGAATDMKMRLGLGGPMSIGTQPIRPSTRSAALRVG